MGVPRTVARMSVPGPSLTLVILPSTAVVVSGGNGLSGAPISGATDFAALSLLPSPSRSSFIPGQPLPLPEDVEPNPAMTHITPVALSNSLELVPEISEKDISEIQGWIKTDQEYEGVLRKMKERMTVEMKGMFGGAMWWEKGSPAVDVNGWKRGCEEFEVWYPLKRGEEKEKEERDKRKRRREGLRLPRKLEPEEENRPEQLIPLRLEFDVEHHKMRDTFVWNLNDPVITPELFAQSIVEDYALEPSYHTVIVKSIQEQLADYRAHSLNYDQDSSEAVVETPKLQGTLDSSHAQWWGVWRRCMKTTSSQTTTIGAARSRKKQKLDAPDATARVNSEEKNMIISDVSIEGGEECGGPMAIGEINLGDELVQEEMRILIKLDIIVGTMELEDQFEWDLGSDSVTPEEFSEIYAQDLGLGGEFKTAVAHIIREQVQMYRKSLFLVGHPSDGTPIQNEEFRQLFLPSLTAGTRPMDQIPFYTPVFNAVSNIDIERSEKKREKEMSKRRKRYPHGRSGVPLPDREPARTHRTPVNGFPGVDPTTLALLVPANVGSRRAAAAAASLIISNMIASENDENNTTYIPPHPTVHPRPPPMKEKKPKYLLRVKPSTTSSLVSAPLENGPLPANTLPPPPFEPKTKVMSKSLTKDLELEAIEKEFADGQYPNWINGVWHCSNCGCPKDMTFDRRSGPLGERSQCGLCGKFWRKHRRPRPVEYNPDPEFHARQSSDTKTPARKKAAAPRAQRTAGQPPPGKVQGATAGPLHSPIMAHSPPAPEGGPPSPQQHQQQQGQFGIPGGASPHMVNMETGGGGMIPHSPMNLDPQENMPQPGQQPDQSGIGRPPSRMTTLANLIPQNPPLPVVQVEDIINTHILQIPTATLEGLKRELGLLGKENKKLTGADKQQILERWLPRRPGNPKPPEPSISRSLANTRMRQPPQILQMQQNGNRRNAGSRGDEVFVMNRMSLPGGGGGGGGVNPPTSMGRMMGMNPPANTYQSPLTAIMVGNNTGGNNTGVGGDPGPDGGNGGGGGNAKEGPGDGMGGIAGGGASGLGMNVNADMNLSTGGSTGRGDFAYDPSLDFIQSIIDAPDAGPSFLGPDVEINFEEELEKWFGSVDPLDLK